MFQAIQTKFHGPTNHRCAKVSAKAEAGKVTVNWKYELSIDENHAEAAFQLALKYKWIADRAEFDREYRGGGLPGSGYAFVNVASKLYR